MPKSIRALLRLAYKNWRELVLLLAITLVAAPLAIIMANL